MAMSYTPLRASAACLAFALLAFAGDGPAGRPRDVAVVQYRAFQTEWSQAHFRLFTEPIFDAVAEQGLERAWVSMDIFLLRNKAARDQYRRIVLSSAACWFMPEMYEGMFDYVRSGGLLITNSPLGGVDRNRNRRIDRLDAWMKRPGNKIVGVHGASNGSVTKVKVTLDCPLTRGLPRGGWTQLSRKMAGKHTRNYTASVAAVSDFIRKGYPGEQPCVLFKRAGAGACVYLVPRIQRESLKDPHLMTILKNALGRETLEWLTKPQKEARQP